MALPVRGVAIAASCGIVLLSGADRDRPRFNHDKDRGNENDNLDFLRLFVIGEVVGEVGDGGWWACGTAATTAVIPAETLEFDAVVGRGGCGVSTFFSGDCDCLPNLR